MSGDKASGLDGVVAADTRLSDVDGEQGRLILVGHDVEELAASVPFEGACALFWEAPADGVRAALGRGRGQAWERMGRLGDALEAVDGMDALRAAMAHLPPPKDSPDGDAELTGAVAVYATAWARRQAGAPPIAPDPERRARHRLPAHAGPAARSSRAWRRSTAISSP